MVGSTRTRRLVCGAVFAAGVSVMAAQAPDQVRTASGVIAAQTVARAAADGHTLLSVGPSFTFMGAVRSRLPYDTEKDFKAVGLAIELPMVVAINRSLPVTNMR